MSQQLSLPVGLRDSACFENYHAQQPEARDCIVAAIRKRTNREATGANESFAVPAYSVIYLWGSAGTGKTHLLHAGCRLAAGLGQVSVYLCLADRTLTVDALEDIERSDLVCLDDVQAVSKDCAWEQRLFAMLEQVRQYCGVVLVTANGPPGEVGFIMPELSSRLASGPVFRLPELDDQAKLAALRLHANHRGFELPEQVARYVLRRYPRDTTSIFDLLDRVDRASLNAQRRITIPFIRGIDL
ncbi:MAG: DnaA regulatory inactivator Hda [Gammaproteobacteria bacterium]|nr:DnaA regulatory inactivator Hda [Gammaproteobacteria bacterium]